MERRLDHDQMTEYIRAVHPDDDGFITIGALTVYGKFRQCHYHGTEAVVDAVSDTYSTKTDIYVSVNSFYLPKRDSRTIRRINAIVADIDISNRYYGDIGVLLEKLRMDIYECRDIPSPSLMIDSGAGCHLYWLLDAVPGLASPFWQAVAGHLASDLRKFLTSVDQYPYEYLKLDIGVSSDTQRLMRLPGTYNQGTGRMCRIMANHSHDVYRLDELRDEYGYGRPARTKRFFPNSGDVNPFYCRLLSDLTKLRDLRFRAGADDWMRKRLTFLFRHFALLAGYTPEQAMEQTKEFNKGFAAPMPDAKLEKHTMSAEKAIKQGKTYRYKVATLLELLDVSKAEMAHLAILVDDLTRQERTRARRKARRTNRGIDGLTAKEREMEAARDVIAELVAAGKTQSEIASYTGYSLSKIKRLRAELAKRGRRRIKRPLPVAMAAGDENLTIVAGGSKPSSLNVFDLTPRWVSAHKQGNFAKPAVGTMSGTIFQDTKPPPARHTE